jgi:hypothetical protein
MYENYKLYFLIKCFFFLKSVSNVKYSKVIPTCTTINVSFVCLPKTSNHNVDTTKWLEALEFVPCHIFWALCLQFL